MKYHRIFPLGVPIRERDKEKFEAAIRERFHNDLAAMSAYFEKTADRQIFKANGILSSTSILAGISYFVGARTPLALALIALLLSLTSYYSKWFTSASYYSGEEQELDNLIHICYDRSLANNISTFLVFITVIWLAFYLI